MNTYPGQQGQTRIEPAAGRFDLRNLGQAWPLAVFWLATIVAAFVSYDTNAAQTKFWILSAAILLFVAIAALGGNHTRWIAYSLAALGAAISIGFLLLHDWNTQPADLAAINRLGRWIMALRPDLPPFETAPNRVGGILAAFLPLVVALAIRPWVGLDLGVRPGGGGSTHRSAPTNAAGGGQLSMNAARIATGVAAAIMAFGLFMTSSRAAWFALLAGGCALLLVRLEAYWTANNAWYRRRRNNFHLAALFALIVLLVLGLLLSEELVATLDRSLPGEASALSRQRIMLNSMRLVDDYLIVGGGLGSFPGLYSEYMLAVPHYSFGYAHNLYIDVSLEQGILGIVALAMILMLALEMALKAAGPGQDPLRRRLAQAVFAGLMVMIIHGFADDAFYGESGTPLLFVLPALAVHLSRTVAAVPPERPSAPLSQANRVWAWAGRVFVLGFFILSFILFEDGLARIYANIGAVQMARVELADFPTGEWQSGAHVGRLSGAQSWLQRALASDPENRPANQRLGLIALQAGDYETAVRHLELAYAEDPRHMGVVKNLGYAYVWLGRFDRALPLLRRIPEARTELEAYAGWWPLHDRRDLGQNAMEMANRLR